MRVGLIIAAAAAAMLAGGEASAENWVRVEASGRGTRTYADVNVHPVPHSYDVLFQASLYIDTDVTDGLFSGGVFHTVTRDMFFVPGGAEQFGVSVAGGLFSANYSINERGRRYSSLSFDLPAIFDRDSLPTRFGTFRTNGGLSFDGGGQYATDFVGGGIDSVTFSRADGFQYLSVSVAAIPEPASWAMMVGGFGLLGATLRRRRTVVTYA